MTSQAESFINLRAAQPEDASQIAPLMIEAGGGFYEFLFEELVPENALLPFFDQMISNDEGPYSWKNCLVAEREGHFAGFANAFPARMLRDQGVGFIPPQRLAHISPINEAMNWEGFFLSSIGVLPRDRGHGVGQAILRNVFSNAMKLGFQNVTLHVWEENKIARKLYELLGFVVVHTAILKPHPKLFQTRSLQMQRELSKD